MESLLLQLAQTKSDFDQALRLIYRAYHGPTGGDGIWLLKHHALPSTNVIVAKAGNRVVGALTIIGDNPFHLPIESHFDCGDLRENSGGRLAELSRTGIADGAEADRVTHALYHFAQCFGAAYCRHDAFVTEYRPGVETLGYKVLKLKNAPVAAWLDPRNCPDFRSLAGLAEYRFPEQKFFLLVHQTMSPDVLAYLFNERSHVFEELADVDLRVLKCLYDYGEFASALPARAAHLPFPRMPRFRRFPTSCDAFLCTGRGKKVNLDVIDVSREGLKVKSDEPLRTGEVYPLTVSVGIMKQSELIATTVWVAERTAGLSVCNRDKNWEKLIEYLEQEAEKAA